MFESNNFDSDSQAISKDLLESSSHYDLFIPTR